MMQVRVARRCHCVIKNDIKELYSYKEKKQAREEAEKMCQLLENNHCKAHIFFIREEGGEIVIDSRFNVDDISL